MTDIASSIGEPPTVAWIAPGPGAWRADRGHSLGASTPITQRLLSTAQTDAMRAGFAEWGIPADTIDVRYVNGHLYTRLRPLVGADRPARKPPPAPILKLLVRLHPEMRRRARRARRTLTERPWRQVVADWSTTTRPEWERRNLALQDVDVLSLTDGQLAGHFAATVAHAEAGVYEHFVLHKADLGPIGMLLVFCGDRGVTSEEVVPLLRGASPSTSGPARLLAEIRRKVAEHGRSLSSLDELRAIAPELDDYLRLHGLRVFSRYDVDGVTLAESPEVVLASVLHGQPPAPASEIDVDAVRQRIAPADRPRFDELLAEARGSMDLRDDNGPYTAEWPLGLLRRAMLEIGRRLVAVGRLAAAEHAFELLPEELLPMLLDDVAPLSPSSVAERAADRRRRSLLTPPDLLGELEAPPPPGVLPPAQAQLVRVVQTVLDELASKEHADLQRGTGIGDRSYVGTVRRAATPEEAIISLEPGDVLVVPFTTPAYNGVLPLVGALVTAEGGPLSHAAVLARELGIPAVVGVAAARDLPDGATVEVNPVAGVVKVLSDRPRMLM